MFKLMKKINCPLWSLCDLHRERAESGHLPRASASEWDSAILFLGTPGTSIPSVDFSFLVCEKGFELMRSLNWMAPNNA